MELAARTLSEKSVSAQRFGKTQEEAANAVR
jgi:hypothetical protein